jgi:(2Fe-2S) ferredoxin
VPGGTASLFAGGHRGELPAPGKQVTFPVMATYDLEGVRHVVFICMGADCRDAGAEEVLAELKTARKELDLKGTVHLVRTRCMDRCDDACNVVVTPGTCWYGEVSPKAARRIAREHLKDGVPVESCVVYRDADQRLQRTGRGKRGKPLQ